MNNKDKLKFIKKWNSAGNFRRNPEPIWKWINSHYISRDKVEGLKMEKRDMSGSLGGLCGIEEMIDEINNKIEEVLK